MTRESAQNGIIKAERQLDRAVELLRDMGTGVEKCPGLLTEAAECLRAIRRDYSFTPEDFSIVSPHIRRIQQKHVLVQELLNTATSFFCGWLAAGAPASASYLPAIDEARHPGSVLVVEA